MDSYYQYSGTAGSWGSQDILMGFEVKLFTKIPIDSCSNRGGPLINFLLVLSLRVHSVSIAFFREFLVRSLNILTMQVRKEESIIGKMDLLHFN